MMTVVMKNWEPLVSLPALAMPEFGEFIDLVVQKGTEMDCVLRRPFLEWRSLKFSSLNLLP